MNLLKAKKPDIADDIAVVIEHEKSVRREKDDIEKQKREEGIREYNPEMDNYVWTGKELTGEDNPTFAMMSGSLVRTGLFPSYE